MQAMKTTATRNPARKKKAGTPKGRSFVDLQKHRLKRLAHLAGVTVKDLARVGVDASVLDSNLRLVRGTVEKLPADTRPPRAARAGALTVGARMELIEPAKFPNIGEGALEVLRVDGKVPNLRYEMGRKEGRGGRAEMRSFGFVPRNAMKPAAAAGAR